MTVDGSIGVGSGGLRGGDTVPAPYNGEKQKAPAAVG